MKTKTTITVETYKFSSVRLMRDVDKTICAGCGSPVSTHDAAADCNCPTDKRLDPKVETTKGELK